MRNYLIALAAFSAILAFPSAAISQSLRIGPGGVQLDTGRDRGQCDELRLACENKDRLGERGEGNCRTYRETCQRPEPRRSRAEVCQELRSACLNKDRLGERGEGNCSKYRATCRGGA